MVGAIVVGRIVGKADEGETVLGTAVVGAHVALVGAVVGATDGVAVVGAHVTLVGAIVGTDVGVVGVPVIGIRQRH